MLSLLSWFLLAMAAGGGLHVTSATTEVMIASDTAAVSAYWHTMLPNTPMPLAILELLTPPAGIVDYIGGRETNNVKTIGETKKDEYIGASFHKARKMGPSTTDDIEKRNNNWGPSVWGSATANDVQKRNNNWGPSVWGSAAANDVQKRNNNWGPSVWGSATANEFQKRNNNWGPSVWGSATANDVQKRNNNWGPSVWGSATANDVQKRNNNWGPSVWGSAATNDAQKRNNNWGPSVWGSAAGNDVQKRNNNWGPSVWGSATSNDVQKRNNNWGPSVWGSATTNDVQKRNNNWGPSVWGSATKGEHKRGDQKDAPLLEMGESHIGRDTMSDMVFLEEALKPGSTITCYIQPSSTSRAPLLRREVADSFPMSMRNFTDIMTFFAPTSSYMAGDIWSTLEFCEHPQAIKGETKTCATSVESMVEFTASVLGVSTYNLQALSSPNVPVEGIMTGRGYKVLAATRVTETGDTVTCHGLRFPFAVFMCHAVNPTRVYSVTLEALGVGLDGVRQRMEVLSVCHLDTSEFDAAKMPVGIKPGDAPICHFISRDSILLAPAATTSARGAA